MPIKDPEKRREYHKQYMKTVWYPANKSRHIALVAKSKKIRHDKIKKEIETIKVQCGRCPENHPACLSFHHKDKSEKEFTIADAVSIGMSLETILEEIKKCDVLCENCHRKLHYEEKLMAG